MHLGSSTCWLVVYPSPCVHHSNQGRQGRLHAAAKQLLPPAMHSLPGPQPMPAHPQEQHSFGPPATAVHDLFAFQRFYQECSLHAIFHTALLEAVKNMSYHTEAACAHDAVDRTKDLHIPFHAHYL